MNRRQFASTLGAAVAGIVAGRTLLGQATPAPTPDKSREHMCAGKNACSGQGGCATKENTCAGQNACKGKGGCASASMRHDCGGKNACKGQGGCGTKDHKCAGLNACKGQGGCAVPPKKKAPAAAPKAT
ncbi:MAG: hypothetical protein NEA02_12555 [Thermoanaerobaculia bacterium]|nr:hypothetical protein [Thermoanaerobaculia bacterium]